MDNNNIIIDWVKDKNKIIDITNNTENKDKNNKDVIIKMNDENNIVLNNEIIIKKKSNFWKIFGYTFIFLLGLFIGFITAIFILDW